MKNIRSILLIVLATVLIYSCGNENEIVKFTFLQLNDVYKIGALEGGEVGGLDRVETLHKELLKENPNTFMFMAGDFLNPSLVGNIKLDGERIKWKHMIEVMNAMNFDLLTFGNHEFDLSDKLLQDRLNSSNFKTIATNIKYKTKDGVKPFYIEKNGINKDILRNVIFNLKNQDGIDLKIGFFSATLNVNPVEYVVYNDFYKSTKQWLNSGKPIKNQKIYTIAFSDYLLKGYDIPFLKPENKGVIKIHHPKEDELAHDIRKLIISYLKSIKE